MKRLPKTHAVMCSTFWADTVTAQMHIRLTSLAKAQCMEGKQMKIIHWLLIGGDGHGTTLPIKGGNSVRYPSKLGLVDQDYIGNQFVLDGQLFQVGLHNPSDS